MKKKATLGYVLKGYPRISETFISNEILILEQLGFKMHLFSMRHPREKFCHPSVEKIQAEVTYLPTELYKELHRLIPANIILACTSPRNYFKAFSYAARQFIKKKKSATIKHFLQAGFLVNVIRKKQLNIAHLHGHFAHSPTSVTLFASLISGTPFSFTAHAKDIYTSSPEALRAKMQKAEFVATCTGYNKTYLEDLRQDVTCPIHNVYHGIDLKLFNGSPKPPSTSPFKILTVARLTEKKGLPTLFAALKQLKDEGVNFEHTLIGDGDDKKQILQLIDDLGLSEQCNWLGTKTHIEVLEEFEKSDLFALSCKIAENGDRDGIPNVLVESLAMGVPAISTSVSAIPELIKHQETGYIVPPSSPEELAAGIKKMLTDQELRETVIAGGRRFVEEYFDNQVQTKRLKKIFVQQASDLNKG